MTFVHSCFTVHVLSARLRVARRRARKILILFSIPANQWPRLVRAQHDLAQYLAPPQQLPSHTGRAQAHLVATISTAVRRGESALSGRSLRGGFQGGRTIPMSTGSPRAAPSAVLATRSK